MPTFECEADRGYEESSGFGGTISHETHYRESVECPTAVDAAREFKHRHGFAPDTVDGDGGQEVFDDCDRCDGLMAEDDMILVRGPEGGWLSVCPACVRPDDRTMADEIREKRDAKLENPPHA